MVEGLGFQDSRGCTASFAFKAIKAAAAASYHNEKGGSRV